MALFLRSDRSINSHVNTICGVRDFSLTISGREKSFGGAVLVEYKCSPEVVSLSGLSTFNSKLSSIVQVLNIML